MRTEPGKTQTESLIESIKEKVRETSDIYKLAALFKWLLADQEYQLVIAPEEENERLYLAYENQLKQIAGTLATAEPESSNDICGLLDFALISIDDEIFADFSKKALKNVRENIGVIFSEERDGCMR
jgi:hypothetical protein